jgi:dihydrofolate reductase
MPRLSLIVALDGNGLIGRGGDLPWRLPADLKHFKRITLGKPVIMGRKTAESLGRPLPGRDNLVLTRNPGWRAGGFHVCAGMEDLVAAVGSAPEAMVIGGADIYRLLLPRTSRAYVTLVDGIFSGDTWFPEWPLRGWRETRREERPSDDANPWGMVFLEYERLGAAGGGADSLENL